MHRTVALRVVDRAAFLIWRKIARDFREWMARSAAPLIFCAAAAWPFRTTPFSYRNLHGNPLQVAQFRGSHHAAPPFLVTRQANGTLTVSPASYGCSALLANQEMLRVDLSITFPSLGRTRTHAQSTLISPRGISK